MSSNITSIDVPSPKFKFVNDVDISPSSKRVKLDYTTIKLPENSEMVVRYDPQNNNYSSMFILDHNNEVIKDFIGDPGKSGVVKEEDIKPNPKDNTFTAKKKVTVFDKPGGKKIGELDAKIKHSYESYYNNEDDSGDDDEPNYINIKYGYQPSFFAKFNQKIADLLFENRDKIKTISKLNKREILSLLKDPVYFPLNKETKERVSLDDDNKANIWIKCKYYAKNGNFASEFIVPTGDAENPKVLTRQELTGKVDPNKVSDPKYKVYGPTLYGTPTLSINEIYIKDAKTIFLQWRVQGVVINKIVPKSATRIRKDQMEDLGKISKEEINELENR